MFWDSNTDAKGGCQAKQLQVLEKTFIINITHWLKFKFRRNVFLKKDQFSS